jgi:hypothetical protein
MDRRALLSRRDALLALLAGTAGCGPALAGTPGAANGAGGSWANGFVDDASSWIVVSLRLRTFPQQSEVHLDQSRPWPANRSDWLFLSLAGDYAVPQTAQSDFYRNGRNQLAVLHGVPPGYDPLLPPASAPSFEKSHFAPMFKLRGSSPAGTREYVAEPRERSDLRDANTYLFILPSSTWVVGRGEGVGPRLEAALANPREPPSLPMASGSLVDTTGCDISGNLIYGTWAAWLKGRDYSDPDRIVAEGEVVYPWPNDGRVRWTQKFVYESERGAAASAADVSKLIADGSARHLRDAEWLLRARSEGANLLLDYQR